MPSTDYPGEDLAPAPSVFTDTQSTPDAVDASTVQYEVVVVVVPQTFNAGFDLI